MTTKIDRINSAYSQMRISGITVKPTPSEIVRALDRLENMMAEFLPRLDVGYSFEITPEPNSLTNVPRQYWQMMDTNLAVRLIPDYNKQVPQTLFSQSVSSYSAASSARAAQTVREVQPPSRQPVGNANTLRTGYRRFYNIPATPPQSTANNVINVGDINDYSEPYAAYLDAGETIDTFVVTSDDGLRILAVSNDTPIINYRAQGVASSTSAAWQQVKIVITTSTGRINTRLVNFEVIPEIEVS